MKNFIEVYDNALSDELCDKIATYMDFVCVDNLGEVWEGDKMVIDAKQKDSYDVPMDLENDQWINQEILSSLKVCIDKYKETHPQFNLINYWKYDNKYNLQKYLPGQAFHKLHCESSSPYCGIHRVAAWMFYLNTVTDGGGTYFDNYDLTMNAVKGRCVIWPAFWTHMHKGVVSKTETKYIATGWISYINNTWVLTGDGEWTKL